MRAICGWRWADGGEMLTIGGSKAWFAWCGSGSVSRLSHIGISIGVGVGRQNEHGEKHRARLDVEHLIKPTPKTNIANEKATLGEKKTKGI